MKNSEIIENVKMNIARGLELFDQEAIRRGIEIWKPIADYPNYAVSSMGNVKNVKTGKTLNPTMNELGYYCVTLSNNGKLKKYKTHRLVAATFVTNPQNKPCVDHIDNNRTDNNVKNLRFATYEENNQNRSIASNNTSGIKGVRWHKRDQKWYAYISVNGILHHIGYYTNLEDAKIARQLKSKEIQGDFQNACEK